MGEVLNTKKGTGGAPGSTPTLSQVLTAGADGGNKAITGITTINGVKVYRAFLTQSGTDAPVVTVLENTLGGTVVWTYSFPGDYTGTLSGAFPSAKTLLFVGQNADLEAAPIIYTLTIGDGTSTIIFSATDVSTLTGMDTASVNVSIEILVYP